MIRQELISKPKNWEWRKLGDCIEILDHKRIPVKAEERRKRILNKKKSELYPYYGATGQVGWIDGFIFNDELVLLGEDGAPFFDLNKNKAYLVKGKFWVNNHAHVLRAKEDILLNSYLCFYLNIINYYGYVIGTTRLKLNQEHLKQIPILLPTLDEQRRIDLILSNINEQNRFSKEIIKNVKKLKQGLLQQLLTRGIGHTEFKETKLGSMPKEWEVVKLGEKIEFKYGIGLREDKRDSNGQFPVYGSNGFIGTHSKPYVNSPCIIIGRKGSVGEVYLSKTECWPIDTTYYVLPPKEIDLYFLFYLLKKLNLRKLSTFTAIPGLNRNDAYNLRIGLPNMKEQKRISQILMNFDYYIQLNESLQQKQHYLKKGLMQQLLTGKIRVIV